MWDDGSLWAGAEEGELRLRACDGCGRICHPPLPICPVCQGGAWTLRVASGEARVKDWLLSTHPARPEEPPRLIIVVELAEGVRFVSNLLDAELSDMVEDMPVRLCFTVIDGVTVPQFRAVSGVAKS